MTAGPVAVIAAITVRPAPVPATMIAKPLVLPRPSGAAKAATRLRTPTRTKTHQNGAIRVAISRSGGVAPVAPATMDIAIGKAAPRPMNPRPVMSRTDPAVTAPARPTVDRSMPKLVRGWVAS